MPHLLPPTQLSSNPWDHGFWLEVTGMRSITSGTRALSRLKDALSLLFVDATVPTSALMNRPTGRRISTGYLTCWTSLSPGVWRLITCGLSQCLNCLLTTRRLMPPSDLKCSLEWFPPHSSRIIVTGMYFGSILLTTSTSIYESNNAVS